MIAADNAILWAAKRTALVLWGYVLGKGIKWLCLCLWYDHREWIYLAVFLVGLWILDRFS